MEAFHDSAESKPRIGMLPEVTDSVLADLRDENMHPVQDHKRHFSEEQPRLYREIIIRANKIMTVGMDATQAFMAGALLTHEALNEQSTRDRARAMEEGEMHFYSRETPTEETRKRFAGTSIMAKLGGLLLASTFRKRGRYKEL